VLALPRLAYTALAKFENSVFTLKMNELFSAHKEFKNATDNRQSFLIVFEENFSYLEGVFDRLRFCDRLLWTVGLTVQILEATFSNFSRVV